MELAEKFQHCQRELMLDAFQKLFGQRPTSPKANASPQPTVRHKFRWGKPGEMTAWDLQA